MNYKDELQKATDILADRGYIFHGQNMRAGGTSLFHMIKHIPEKQRIEVPVFEDIQMGMSLGMSLNGDNVCTIFPRWDFLLCAINQLVNHLDKIRLMSDGQLKAKGLIIRTCVGSVKPLFPGEQHCGDYTEAAALMCKEVKVVKLKSPEQIVPAYSEAMESETPTLIVEIPDNYNMDLTEELIESRAQKTIR
jgi:pyruvate/2-oxoglutarate/acetoin dehydrogenase E1 component